MSNHTQRLLCVTAALVILPACNGDNTRVRNCPLVSYNSGDQYLLDYRLEIPRDCPVPQGSQGEIKRAAAFVYDFGNSDFRFGHVVITNANGAFVQNSYQEFRYENYQDASGNNVVRYTALPTTNYEASTAGFLTTDYGDFRASNSESFRGNPGDPFGRVQITYQSSTVKVATTGPAVPTSSETATWYANATGGHAPYSYTWYRDGAYVGSGSSYTGAAGSQDFILRAEVTDASMATRATIFPVDVDGVTASISGPTLVYASQGGGTWTASSQGGHAPHSYNWYVDGNWVSDGSEFGGYPGEGGHELRVDVRNAAGAVTSTSFHVTGLGRGDGSCDPVPPQLTCNVDG